MHAHVLPSRAATALTASETSAAEASEEIGEHLLELTQDVPDAGCLEVEPAAHAAARVRRNA